jgi:Cu-Zn family superoxide dismutase
MITPGHRRAIAAVLFAAPVAVLSACSPNQPPSDAPGTTPSVWTGSPAPSTPEKSGAATTQDSLVTGLKAPDGTEVASAKFEFAADYVTITVTSTGQGDLTPGFHGLHIHKVGKCEPNSVAPTGGASGDFNSAGGHYQAPGHSTEPASGDLTSLQVRKDGGALLVTTTDAFTHDDLVGGDGTALVVHGGSDNFANIPPERYSQTNGGEPGPDETTMTTGDAGKRVACGVIGSG